MNEKPIRVVLVDDHEILRSGLRQLLAKYPTVLVVGEASTPEEASAVTQRERPDVVILDLNLGDRDGLDWAKQMIEGGEKARLVVLTSVADNGRVQEAMRLGVSAYLVKTSGAEELVRAIQLAREGHLYLCPQVMSTLLRSSALGAEDPLRGAEAQPLSGKDREIVRLVALGLRNKEIAEQMHFSVKTVETYRVRLMHRLGCESTADLVRWAIREKLITP